MTEFTVERARAGDERALFDLIATALHRPAPHDDLWERCDPSVYSLDRKFAAYTPDGEPLGFTGSFRSDLAVPGGALVPAAAVDGVAVRADSTRRGILTGLMDRQLRDCADRGEVAAMLHASEATIYGRFGYGVAVKAAEVVVDSRRARLRPGVPLSGSVRMVDPERDPGLLPRAYRRVGPHRPGMMTRPDAWWQRGRHLVLGRGGHHAAVHFDDAGEPDGFVVYKPAASDHHGHVNSLWVRELHGADLGVRLNLWRFLLSIDLIEDIHAGGRPVDEPLDLVLTDPRAFRITDVEDSLWLRLVDVPAALAARTYGAAEPVLVGVTDRQLPANSGCYRVGPDGVERVSADPELEVDVETLAMLYLGHWRASLLGQTGRLGANPDVLARADVLFTTAEPPWNGTGF
ncbi:GNAT family N-acetyltransferase [Amycolatopsis suaedae]|uniref:GNAT family N-acetyltransferase n=1 Tax=Amycolatopsis suaedae TaxID=2510978 RepID=A0A4Q7JDP9_9PSEU|nr:GNAT family N-acetyltransferase [Amycolatopsis suaedae]RZQ66020.1 GNAT family N-acetyltransferase [Amycolatopsis suaedae]